MSWPVRSLSRGVIKTLRFLSFTSLSETSEIKDNLSSVNNSENFVSFVKSKYKEFSPEDVQMLAKKAVQSDNQIIHFLKSSHVLDYLVLKHSPHLDQFAVVELFIYLSKLGPSYALMASSKLLIHYAHRTPLDDLIAVDMCCEKLSYLSYIRELRRALVIGMCNNYLQLRIINPIMIVHFIKVLSSDETDLINYALSCLVKYHKNSFPKISVHLLESLAHHELRLVDYLCTCCNFLTENELSWDESLSVFQSLSTLRYFSLPVIRQILIKAANSALTFDQALILIKCMHDISVVTPDSLTSCLKVLASNTLNPKECITILQAIAKFSPVVDTAPDHVDRLNNQLNHSQLSSLDLFLIIEALYCLNVDASHFLSSLMKHPQLSDLNPVQRDFLIRALNIDFFKTLTSSSNNSIPDKQIDALKNVCKKRGYRFALTPNSYCSDAMVTVDDDTPVLSLLALDHSDFIQNQGRLNGYALMRKQMSDIQYLTFCYFKPKFKTVPDDELEDLIDREIRLILRRNETTYSAEPPQM